MQCTLTESNAEILLLMPNILEWGYDKINLFELHIKSDTVIINYTTTEGKQRDFKFPLAGFKEKYLEQFILIIYLCSYDMPKLYIIAGCNGAGKTTASYTVLVAKSSSMPMKLQKGCRRSIPKAWQSKQGG